jgi:hypothetical protein
VGLGLAVLGSPGHLAKADQADVDSGLAELAEPHEESQVWREEMDQ